MMMRIKYWKQGRGKTIWIGTFVLACLSLGACAEKKTEAAPGGSQPQAQAAEVAPPPPPKPVGPFKGIYLTAETTATPYGEELIDTLVKSGGNAVVVDLQEGGGLLAFTPQDEELKKANPGSGKLNSFAERIREWHQRGIYVIARQTVFNQPYLGSRKPEWRIKGKWGGYYPEKWLDPSLPAVQDYNLSILKEAIALGFDEVQFDYIRFPAANHKNYDYAYDEAKMTRAEVILDFLKKARAVADESHVALGADLFGVVVWGDVDWKVVGQNPAEIAKIVDAIYPMTYPSHFGEGFQGHKNVHNAPYGIVFDSIQRFVAASGGKAEIRPWIQGFPLKVKHFGSWYMEEQVKASFDAGAKGFMIWSPGNHYGYSWPTFGMKPPAEKPAEEPQEEKPETPPPLSKPK